MSTFIKSCWSICSVVFTFAHVINIKISIAVPENEEEAGEEFCSYEQPADPRWWEELQYTGGTHADTGKT